MLEFCEGDLGVSQNQGYLLGVPIMRIFVFWGHIWGPHILGNYHLANSFNMRLFAGRVQVRSSIVYARYSGKMLKKPGSPT